MATNRSNKQKQQSLSGQLQRSSTETLLMGTLPAPSGNTIRLPELVDNFNHAVFKSVALGPRRELTMELIPLIWVGNRAQGGSTVCVRLGGIVDFEQVKALSDKGYHKCSELCWLRYDPNQTFKSGSIHLQLEFERVQAGMAIQCSHLTVTDAGPSTE